METRQTEGIIVKAFPFKDYDRILSLFTPHEGLIKLVYKGAFSSKNGKGATSEPLKKVEVSYLQKNSELYTCYELVPISSYALLRTCYSSLQAAGEMLNLVYKTQMPGKAAPALYALLDTYLGKLKGREVANNLSISFILKMLRHEGLLVLNENCPVCGTRLEGCYAGENGLFCPPHRPPGAIQFSDEERLLMSILAYSREFPQIEALETPQGFFEKVKAFAYCKI